VILPQFIILPVMLALVWFALSRGLSPLAAAAGAHPRAPPDDLSPIDSRQVPEEISPLVGSLNDMLERSRTRSRCRSASSPTPRTR
jgi:two-component system sensor histidine kinase TctE